MIKKWATIACWCSAHSFEKGSRYEWIPIPTATGDKICERDVSGSTLNWRPEKFWWKLRICTSNYLIQMSPMTSFNIWYRNINHNMWLDKKWNWEVSWEVSNSRIIQWAEMKQKCLKDLVSKVAIAIRDLHHCGWAHQDIRLENICFTMKCKPILIDLDWVCRVTD